VLLRVLRGSRFGLELLHSPRIIWIFRRKCFTNRTMLASQPIARLSAQQVSHAVLTAAIRVHSELGPGLLESTYEACLHFELQRSGHSCAVQVGLPVVYQGVKLELGYRMDMIVDNLVVVEIKSLDAISPVHKAQIISYLKLSNKSIGLLINFNVVHLKDGIKRFVNGDGWRA
jgi:GxxExxY protein